MGYLLDHLLQESADRDPGAVALRYEDEVLTYGELEGRSNRLARVLREVGVADGDRVGLHLKKSADAIVSLFAILKAGACVVPVNAGMPAPRFRAIAGQSGMRCLIATVQAAAQLGPDALHGTAVDRVVYTGPDHDQFVGMASLEVSGPSLAAQASPEPLPSGAIDRDLAYVLFTSGSTGVPKGVMLSHRAVLTFVHWAGDTFGVRPTDRLSNHASLSFDLSTFDIYAAMRAGASVAVVPEGLSAFPSRLAAWIEEHRITIWYSVPSVLAMLASRGGLARRRLDDLRIVLFAGEVFPVQHLRQVMEALPTPRYFNLYGPTETNVCTYHEVTRPPEPGDPPLPIGKACANTRTVVLDDTGAVVSAPGVEGVLHVGGSTLMDGYFGLPEESAAALRARPNGIGGEQTMYCTGDVVTIDDEGSYLFVGRVDHLVKIGGHRVELGEVEAALHRCPGVEDAAAVAVPDEVIGSRLRAVVVAAAGAALDAQSVRRHCASLLPAYMVPHEVDFRASLPRTSTGKVDRPSLASEPPGS